MKNETKILVTRLNRMIAKLSKKIEMSRTIKKSTNSQSLKLNKFINDNYIEKHDLSYDKLSDLLNKNDEKILNSSLTERLNAEDYNYIYDDVKKAKIHPSVHYNSHGHKEHRAQCAPEEKKQKTIAILTHNLENQGAQNSLLALVREFEKNYKEFKIVLITPKLGPLLTEYEKIPRLKIININQNYMRIKSQADFLKLTSKIVNALQNLDVRLVYSNTLVTYFGSELAKKIGAKSILNIRESLTVSDFFSAAPTSYIPFIEEQIKKFDQVVFVSKTTRSLFPEIQKAVTIYNAIDTSTLTNTKGTHSEKLSEGKKIEIVVVGTICERKNQAIIAAALQNLESICVEKIKITFYGGNNSKYELSVINELNLVENLEWNIYPETQTEDEKEKFVQHFSNSDIFIFASKNESMPRTVLEACFFGCAIITTPCFGVTEILRKEDALFFEPDDAIMLADHITYLINKPSRIAKLSNKSSNRFTHFNNFEKMLSKYVNVIDSLDFHESTNKKQYGKSVSICIISKTYSLLKNCIFSIGTEFDGEILVSWNGSNNDLVRLKEIFPKINFQTREYHYSENLNFLAQSCAYDNLIFLNDDVVLYSNTIPKIESSLNDPSIGVVGCNLFYESGNIQHKGISIENDKPIHNNKNQKLEEVGGLISHFCTAVTGACLAIRKDEFLNLKFDANYKVAAQDVDLCLRYQMVYRRGVYVPSEALALHIENGTRKHTGQKLTPKDDLKRLEKCIHQFKSRFSTARNSPLVSIHTEKKGWIMHRKAIEIQNSFPKSSVRINSEIWKEADISYFINYGYYSENHSGIPICNYTHYDKDKLSKTFIHTLNRTSYGVSVSNETTKKINALGFASNEIKTIVVGANKNISPKLVLGVVGRTYTGGRKGEELVRKLADDHELREKVLFVSYSEDWGCKHIDIPTNDFYNLLDFLFVPSTIEGGPVPFMEALSTGIQSIAPPIGVIPEFSHIHYETGSFISAKSVILRECERKEKRLSPITNEICGLNWEGWGLQHEKFFRQVTIAEKGVKYEN